MANNRPVAMARPVARDLRPGVGDESERRGVESEANFYKIR